jgi:hypothetical protein
MHCLRHIVKRQQLQAFYKDGEWRSLQAGMLVLHYSLDNTAGWSTYARAFEIA